jgi:molecular chaperone HscB
MTVRCGNCGGEVSAGAVCPCGEPQPFPEGSDHFAIFGLSRKLELDPEALERDFYALSQKHHPDFYQTKSSRAQAVSLENSARVNLAYRTLRDPLARVEYLLGLEGFPVGAPSSNPPAELFEEIFELQEARQESRVSRATDLEARLRSAHRDLEGRKAALEEELYGLFGEWDRLSAGAAEGREGRRKLLERMRGILATRAYLRTVLRDITEDLKGS